MPNFLRPHQIFQEIQGFIAFLCGNIFSNFSRLHLIILAKSWWNFTWIRQNRNKKIFQTKKLEIHKVFAPPHQIFQENQGFIAFLCGNISQIFAVVSYFLSDFVIVAKTWLKKGPKKENFFKPNLT